MDGVAHSLLAASEVLRYLRDLIPPRTRQEHLGTAQSESVFGAQSGFEPLALLSRQRTCEDRWFHGSYHNSQSGTYTDDALDRSPRAILRSSHPSLLDKNSSGCNLTSEWMVYRCCTDDSKGE